MIKILTLRYFSPKTNSTAYKGNAKIWWKFAYDCVMETEIKRRKRDWSWENMHNHRNMCRAYADAYRTKLTAKKLPNDVQQCIDRTEEALDLFNLVLIRKRVNFEVEQSGILQKPQQSSGSWFSGWWGGGKSDEPDNKDKDICMLPFFRI